MNLCIIQVGDQTNTKHPMASENHIQAFARVLRHLGVLYTQIASRQSSAHATYSKQELLAIDVLGVRGSCRMGEIAEHLGVVQSAITPLVDRLETQGLVERVRSTEDRRVWLVALTQEGQTLNADQEKLHQAIATEMLAPLNESEQATLIALLSRMAATMA